MASTRCWKCQDRPSSRVGGMCYTCWAATGKPEKEKALALRAEALDPRALPLSTDLADTLPAMRFVIANPASADTTHQHKSMREWREASPTSFYGRLADLEKAELGSKPANGSNGTGPAEWTGEGPCPTCNRQPGPVVGPDPKGPELERMMEAFEADMAKQMAAADAEFIAQPGAEKLGATLKAKLAASQDEVRRLKERIRELEGRARPVPA